MSYENQTTQGLRSKLHEVIFEADTKAGRAFDLVLIFKREN